MNKKINNFYYFFFFLLITIAFGLGLYYFQLNNKAKKNFISNTPTLIPVVRKEEELPIPTIEPTTGKKILEIPVIFTVKSITDEEIVLQKEGGNENDVAQYYPKKYPIKVFFNLPPNEKPAGLADLKIGLRIKVFNHLEEANYFYILK